MDVRYLLALAPDGRTHAWRSGLAPCGERQWRAARGVESESGRDSKWRSRYRLGLEQSSPVPTDSGTGGQSCSV